MGTLREKVSDPAARQRAIDEGIKTVDAEVSERTGLGGMALKAAYAMVKGIAPGIMPKLLNNMLDEMMDALQPFHDQAKQAGVDLRQHFAQQPARVADALLGVTDRRAAKADAGPLKKGYEKLRPVAQKHVEQALPRLADLVKSLAS
jgi:hypothetical protein